jgi:hypothetical protein
MFEGDIRATFEQVAGAYNEETAANALAQGLLVEGSNRRRLGAPSGNKDRLWTNRTVYFKWSIMSNLQMRESFDSAMRELTGKVLLRFIELVDDGDDDGDFPSGNYIDVVDNESSRCFSSGIGMQGGRQAINLARSCWTPSGGAVLHQLIHAVGMWHEQSNANRDDYVEIQWDNIEEGRESNFQKRTNSIDLGVYYDYGSIMHYGKYAFSNGELGDLSTIKAMGNHYGKTNEENEAEMGSREGLSDTDAVQLQLMYHCPSGPRHIMDLCSPECQCTDGQGHCDTDDDCRDNLSCQRPSAPYYRHRTHRVEMPQSTFKVCVSGDCDCDYHAGGCSISKVPPPNWACRCEYEGAWTCSGTLDYCADDDAEKCKAPDSSIETCAQGGGECGGYSEADGDCDCEYHAGGCSISTPAPSGLACKCQYKGAWTCGGETQLCLDSNDAACKNPDKSIQACAQGGGDCGGYSEADGDCDCEYHSGGCSISTPAPSGLACKCQYKGAWTCGGQTQLCLDSNDAACKNPDKSIHACAQGGGDCGGYSEADGDCDCEYHSGGCSISTPAPSGLACKCKYKGFWTCGGDAAACKDPASWFCRNPGFDYQSCLQGGGDCGGY